MKPIACALAIGLATLPFAASAEESVFFDGDFEAPPKKVASGTLSFLSGAWMTYFNRCDPSAAKVFVDSAQKHGGAKSLSVQGSTPANGFAGAIHQVPTRKGDNFEISFWYRTALTKGNAVFSLSHVLKWQEVPLPASSDWKEFRHQFTIGEYTKPDAIALEINVILGLSRNTDGQVWFDDVILKKVP